MEVDQFTPIQQAIKSLFGGDHISDPSRVMQLPGFYSHKPDRPSFLSHIAQENPGLPYSGEVILRTLGRQGASNEHRGQEERERADTAPLSELRLTSKTKRYILDGVEKGQRSEVIWAIINEMLGVGYSEEIIANVLSDPSYGISERVLEKGEKVLWKEIGKAQAQQRQKASPRQTTPFQAPQFHKAAEITPKEVDWYWDGYVPIGEVTELTGDSGIGKTMLLMTLIAARTQGGTRLYDLPGQTNPGDPTNVLYLTEDSPEHTIVPRLMAAEADLERVIVTDDKFDIGSPEGLACLRSTIQQTQAKLVIFDPLSSFVERKLDNNDTIAIRAPRVLAMAKNNLGKLAPSQRFSLGEGKVRWEGPSSKTADDLAAPEENQGKQADAETFIMEELERNPGTGILIKEFEQVALREGIAKRIFRRAKESLKKQGKIRYRPLPTDQGTGPWCIYLNVEEVPPEQLC